jgi:hypothetical protein
MGPGRFTNNVKFLINLPLLEYSIIVGQLLSDGWLDKFSFNSKP